MEGLVLLDLLEFIKVFNNKKNCVILNVFVLFKKYYKRLLCLL